MGEKLKTQDKLQAWETRFNSGVSSVCAFCSQVADLHSHLFFECTYASQIWNYSKSLSKIAMGAPSWQNVISSIDTISGKMTYSIIVAKLVFGASVYFIWQERNRRLFSRKAMGCDKVKELIFSTVRMKIMAISWNNTKTFRL
ncbi:uncharacterized protein [Rutidosis leptorrhynchoides]|uniref:uncharacterized protein n=1 Tax=Rutidosis leptorrhynchoides TaxID=125765 RepID=UPI003A99D968